MDDELLLGDMVSLEVRRGRKGAVANGFTFASIHAA